jgi:glycosyltransferase involved in cell wall biosynthesis
MRLERKQIDANSYILKDTYMSKTILYIITKSNFGGAQLYVFDLAKAAVEAGHQVHVAVGGDGLLLEKLATLDCTVHSVVGFQRDIGVTAEWQALVSLRKIIRSVKPTVVHLNSSKAGLLGGLVARWCRVPTIIFTAHGWPFFEPRPWWWRLMAWSGSWLTAVLAHTVICVSTFDTTQAWLPGVRHKLHTIHNGIVLPPRLTRTEARARLFLNQSLIPPHATWIVSIGELNHNKNIQVVLEALTTLKQTDPDTPFFYTLMGTGELEGSIRHFISSYSLTNDVTLLGFVDDPFQYLNAFDVLILPSKKEGLPYTILYALMSGIPTIASNVGGVTEALEVAEKTTLMNPYNKDTVRVALLAAARDTKDNQQEHITRNLPQFALATMVEKTFALYE